MSTEGKRHSPAINAQVNAYLDGLLSVGEEQTAAALGDVTGVGVGGLIRELGPIADRELEDIRLRAQVGGAFNGAPPACKTGCSHCCNQAVGASVPEVLSLAAWLRTNRTEEELAEVRAAAADYRGKLEGLTNQQRGASRDPCPLLKNGTCSVYEARPLACRSFHSYDLSACLRFEAGDNNAVQVNKHVLPEMRIAVDAIRRGIRKAVDSKHLPTPAGVFGIAISIALENEDAAERWLAGEDVFAPAKVGA